MKKLFLLGCLSAFMLLARPASSETMGFYSSWSYDAESGYVYMSAETWADYGIGYYYDLYVCMQLHVTPDQGNYFSTCWMQDWSTDISAFVECSTTVPVPSAIWLDSYHEVTVTYYAYQFYEYCYIVGTCYGWWDQDELDFLGIDGQTFEENMSWYAPGPPAILVENQIVSRGSRARRATLCPSPTGETTSYKGWIDLVTSEGGKFEMTLTGSGTPNFVGREIRETYGSATDGCYAAYPNSQYGQLPAPPGGGVWTVQSGNKYFFDVRAEPKDWFAYYRTHIQSPCSHSSFQRMKIGPCAGGGSWQFFEPGHDIGLTVYPYPSQQLGAFRAGVFGYKY